MQSQTFRLRIGKRTQRVITLSLLLATALLWSAWRELLPPAVSPLTSAIPDLAALPISFEPNAGQTDPSVSFMARAPGSTIYFTDSELVVTLQNGSPPGGDGQRPSRGNALLSPVSDAEPPVLNEPSVVRLEFIGADVARITGEGSPLPGKVNYIYGKDPAAWRTNIPTYASIAYEDLYPGIDLRYEGSNSHLKGTYIVSPGADPSQISWRYHGTQGITIDEAGNLQITLDSSLNPQSSVLTEQAPVAWQEIDGSQVPVDARYALAADGTVSFLLGAYDPAYALTVDPTITYSTYLGGSGWDICVAIAVRNGNAYVTGWTDSVNFPLRDPFQPTNHGGGYDVFVTQLSASGSALVYSTYLGGSDWDQAQSIAVDNQGNAYVTGQTKSPDFPVLNAYQPALGSVGLIDAFLTKLDPTGSALVYSTFLGGSNYDQGYRVAVDTDGSALLTGTTHSPNFPLSNPYQQNLLGANDAFVTRFAPDGQSLTYSTYLGGNEVDYGNGIAIDPLGRAYVVGYTFSTDFPVLNAYQPNNAGGSDAFITRFNADGQSLSYSTYLGGSGINFQANDVAWVVTADSAGNAYIAGHTMSFSFPTRNAFQPSYGGGFQDAFVTKLKPTGSDLVYSTYLGGTVTDNGEGIAVDSAGHAYVGGSTGSVDFPTRNPISNQGRAYMTKLTVEGNDLLFSSRFGGTDSQEFGHAMTIDPAGSIYLAGNTESQDFPVVNAFQIINRGGYDAFISKISDVVTSTTTPSPGTPTTPTSTFTAVAPSNTPTNTRTSTPLPPTNTVTRTNTPQPIATNTTGPGVTPSPTGTTLPKVTSTGTTVSLTATPTLCPLQFTDVPSGHTFYADIRCLACRDIISGYTSGCEAGTPCFRPGNNVTRGQIAKIVSNSANFTGPVSGQTFEDVPPGSTFYDFIERLAARGVMSGYPCGDPGEPCIPPGNRSYFRTNATATRGQLSKIVSNAGNFQEPVNGQTFEDAPPGSTFYDFIERLAARGVMSGYPCGDPGEPCIPPDDLPYFRPGNTVTRGQTTKIVANTFFPGCETPRR